MTLWIIFGIFTIATLLLLFAPFWFRPNKALQVSADFDAEVYRDQLSELERDGARGLIDEVEQSSARNEISRRLLLASENAEKDQRNVGAPKNTSNVVVGIATIAILGLSGLVYGKIGQPNLPDVPQRQRIDNAAKNQDMPALVIKVQKFLQNNPEDLRGWKVLAPALKRMKRYNEAADAYASIMKLDKPTPELLTDYAESLLLGNKGELTPRVKTALLTAMKMDPTYKKAGFYWAAALQQDGQFKQARAVWRGLMEKNPKDLQLQMFAQRQIIEINKQAGDQKAKMPALDKDQREAAAGMTAKERQQMIASMVERLASKLKENGKDLDGWMRLIRARTVLGDKAGALDAIKQAKINFANDKPALDKLKSVEQQLK